MATGKITLTVLGSLLMALMGSAVVAQPDVITVGSTQDASRVTIGGVVVPYREVTLTAQIPGRVDFIAGEEGARFSGRQPLAAINDDDLRARRAQVIAQLQQAEAALRNAGVQYQRELINPQVDNITRFPGMGSPAFMDQFIARNAGRFLGLNYPEVDRYGDLYASSSQYSQAQASWFQARATLEEIDAQLQDAVSYAPWSGVITDQLAEVGDTVQPGQPLLKFASTRYLRIEADIPSRLVQTLERGMTVPARLDTTNERYQTRVAQIFPTADADRHTVKVKFDLPQGVPASPGTYAEVMVSDPASADTVLPVIPMSAVVQPGSLPGVYVLDGQERPRLRMIRLGDRVGEERVMVLSGLSPGDRIVADPQSLSFGQTSG